MSKVKKASKNMPKMICAAAVMALIWSVPALAEEQSGQEMPRSQWIDMEKGPGEARWVDENGVISDVPGVKPDRMGRQGEDEEKRVGPGYADQNQENDTDQNGGNASAGESGEDAGNAAPGDTGQNDGDGAPGEDGQPVQNGEDSGTGQNGQTSERVIDPARPMVALTFDDGPYAPVGNQIMDCLAQYGGKATFFVVGSRCAAYQAEMQRMAAEGHEIGNHTYEHKYLNKLGPDQILYQVNKGSEAVQASCGVIPVTVRLPGGNKNAAVLATVHDPIIMWSLDTLDWKTRNTQSTVDKVLGTVGDGDIVLMHELYRQTGDAAVQIIPALVERGFQLVTVSELAQYRGGLQGGQVYSAFWP